MASYVWSRFFPIKDVRSFEDWTSNQFGKKLYSIFFKTYTEKVWGMPCDEMSADWAAQRIKGLSLGAAVIDGLKRSLGLNKRPNNGMQTKTLLETFRYPRLGPGMMWDAARDRIVEAGSTVLMGHGLKQLASDSQGGWRMTATRADGGETVIRAAHAISSAPMRELAARMHPLPQTTLEASRLRYRDFLTVALKIRSEDLFPDNWIYIHDSKVRVGRIQNFRSWSPEMVPDDGVACVGLEYFCFEGDDLWASTDDALIELATKEMAILGLVRPEQVIGGAVVRQEKAYPVYDDEYAANVAAMRGELDQDHAMMTAMLSVENIMAGSRVYDIWCVNEDAEYHEAGDEGDTKALPSRPGQRTISEDSQAALDSVRAVPERVKKDGRKAA
jgi:protoporphyrinogen oxidase